MWFPSRPHHSNPIDCHSILPKEERVRDALELDVRVVLDLVVVVLPPLDLSCMPTQDVR